MRVQVISRWRGVGGGGRAKLIYYASQNKFMILSVETVYIYYEFKM